MAWSGEEIEIHPWSRREFQNGKLWRCFTKRQKCEDDLKAVSDKEQFIPFSNVLYLRSCHLRAETGFALAAHTDKVC